MIDQQIYQTPTGTTSSLSRENATSVDIIKLVDKLEELMEGGPQLFGRSLWVNAEEFFVHTNKIRAFLPQEMKRASQVSDDSELILAEARMQAQTILAQAEREAEERVARATEEAGRLISRDEVRRQADQQAEHIINEARNVAQSLNAGADKYALEVLTNLGTYVDQIQGTIRGGCQKLAKREETSVSR